ncbi:hypothetical protein CDAR_435081 [Caerostris darwini]|uniref:Uncharacterized protein n=1 Tax=Caerostris darwini TaxID=1538125 RepID=A0AAV4UIN8_9ARAC|nr:hypothetical protein CDAR_435081 [Caerostris darwini]
MDCVSGKGANKKNSTHDHSHGGEIQQSKANSQVFKTQHATGYFFHLQKKQSKNVKKLYWELDSDFLESGFYLHVAKVFILLVGDSFSVLFRNDICILKSSFQGTCCGWRYLKE